MYHKKVKTVITVKIKYHWFLFYFIYSPNQLKIEILL